MSKRRRTAYRPIKAKSDRPETSWQRAWREYKDKPEYMSSVFPFPPRRKTLFDKLHDDLLALFTLAGFIGLAAALVRYVIS